MPCYPQFERASDYFDYFNGSEVPPDVDQLHDRRLKAGLQKTYLLETVDGGKSRKQAERSFYLCAQQFSGQRTPPRRLASLGIAK